MSFRFCSLSSGSSGNCQYIETDKMKVLVDAGLSGKKTQELLMSIDVDASEIDCILVSHEHGDHVKGAGILSRRFDIPIYANKNTWNRMEDGLGKLKDHNIKTFNTDCDFELGDLGILPFKVSHDSAEAVGYSFYNKNKKISVLTDTGCVDDQIKYNIKNSNLLMIESNHDVNMLKMGSYPWFLKQRVSGEFGHLSNDDAGNLIAEVICGQNENILLGHLSGENNFPELAHQTVCNILNENGIDIFKDVSLDLTFKDKATKVYKI